MADTEVAAAIALTRFGMGARTGEIADVSRDPQGWLKAQIRPEGAPLPQSQNGGTGEAMAGYDDYRRATAQRRQARRAGDENPTAEATAAMSAPSPEVMPQPADPAKPAQGVAPPNTAQAEFDSRRDVRRELVRRTAGDFLARTQLGVETPDGFAERWALFWANQISVSATKFQSGVFIPAYERDAIRPHVFGPFEELLLAAERHPAMLLYLDQAQSIGPDSPAGQRRSAGLNENLAREIMELHTLGADGGYAQADVTELARALTGWTLGGAGAPAARAMSGRATGAGRGGRRAMRAARAAETEADAPGFAFRPAVHEPGSRTILGKTYPAAGADQGEAALRDLARHPATARRLCTRIAAHFVSDTPSEALVKTLEEAWSRSGGRLDTVAEALITAPDAWAPALAKMKTPYEFLVSTYRILGVSPRMPNAVQPALATMGQPAFSPPSPEGWPDTAADWAGPDALVKRLEWASAVADRAPERLDPAEAAAQALGGRLSERTRLAVARAENRPEALTLLLMSPEFQRR